jgi:uncharacterized membrane protein HdeD (DUF308 family)
MANSTDTGNPMGNMRGIVTEHRSWFMILGICLVILGIVAIVFPLLSTIVVKTFIGWLFLIGGVIQVIHAFSTQKWGAFFFNLLVGILYVFVGGWLAFFPLTGILTLTILLSALFIVQGIVEILMSFRLRPHGGWGWVLVSGILAFVVGILIFSELPSSAAWAIGLLAGINLLSSGWAYFFLALAAGKRG